MASSFTDKSKAPDDKTLAEMLGKAGKHWDALVKHLDADPTGLIGEWKFYGPKYGWQLKVSCKRRAVLYLVPGQDCFLAAMALNDSAVEAVRESGLPASLIREIETAKAYPEGRPARVNVTAKNRVEIVKRLLAIKLAS
jgi:Protein of unknown function (DUF3788)